MNGGTEFFLRNRGAMPDPVFKEHQAHLHQRLEQMGANLPPEEFDSLLDPLMRENLAAGFSEAGAHEGTIWLLDETNENLQPVLNTGPNAARFVGSFKQPLNTGLICMVMATEQPFLENEVWKNTRQSKLLDSRLQVETCAMIAVPFYFLRACRGVISCVKLKTPGAADYPPPFGSNDLAAVLRTTAVLSKLIDFHFLGRAVGWGEE